MLLFMVGLAAAANDHIPQGVFCSKDRYVFIISGRHAHYSDSGSGEQWDGVVDTLAGGRISISPDQSVREFYFVETPRGILKVGDWRIPDYPQSYLYKKGPCN